MWLPDVPVFNKAVFPDFVRSAQPPTNPTAFFGVDRLFLTPVHYCPVPVTAVVPKTKFVASVKIIKPTAVTAAIVSAKLKAVVPVDGPEKITAVIKKSKIIARIKGIC